MTTALQRDMGKFAASVAQQALNSGLTWDQAVSALGLATKILVVSAPLDEAQATEMAQKRLADGLAQSVDAIVAEHAASGLAGGP